MLGGASFKKWFKTINDINQKTGKNKIILAFDMVGCAIKYGAGYNDYNIFEFYNMKANERKTYLARLKNKKLISKVNNQKYFHIFNEKKFFVKYFAEFLKREALVLDEIDFERFDKFVQGKEVFFAKPSGGECGKGIEKIHIDQFKDSKEIWEYIKQPEKNFGVIEEAIVQHPDVARIYPESVNCLRVVTLVADGKPHVLYAVFKTGNNGKFVDNLESGGIACHVDLDKGVINGQGHTSALVNYDCHPATGIQFVGYKIPYIEEVKELVKKAAMVIPEFRYVGWDVCITPDGPAIIEGNDYPAYDFPQLPDPDKPRIGLLPKLQELGIRL